MMVELSRIPLALRALGVVLVLSGILVWMIVDRARLLQTGREVVLKTEPMDPRDIFRGHYARLNYEISRIPSNLVEDLKPGVYASGGSAIHVILAPGGDGFWHPVRALLGTPRTIAPGRVMLKGRLKWTIDGGSSGAIAVTYGIERYYASRKRALDVERLGRDRDTPVGVIVRVSPAGKAAIAGLMIKGRKVYEEPLW